MSSMEIYRGNPRIDFVSLYILSDPNHLSMHFLSFDMYLLSLAKARNAYDQGDLRAITVDLLEKFTKALFLRVPQHVSELVLFPARFP